MQLCRDYSSHFIVHGRDVTGHARHYLSGLLGRERRKNIERIEADVAGSNYQGMQQFITDSPWDHAAVMDQIARDADGLLGAHRDCALYLDETSFVKKGDRSVGVQRQYCGRLGKTENCQVGVFACMGRGAHAALIDFRLFLPESWAADKERCERAKIPESEQMHRTKTELALAMVQAARARGSRHRWIGGDEVYGGNLAFCAQLEDMGESFLMDVGANITVWDADPAPAVPPAPDRGRPTRRAVRTTEAAQKWTVEKLSRTHFTGGSREVRLRASSQGPLHASVWVSRVWLWAEGSPRARERQLIVRREEDGRYKYSLSNAPADTPWERLAHMQAQRYWIEAAFKEAKSELGMAQYEVRGWRGWHHHMALVCLAQFFTVRERQGAAESHPLLSVRDIVELLACYLPRRNRDEAEVHRQIAQRHQRREQAAKSHAKRRRRRRKSRIIS
jgi:SRSO17 transposase